MICILKFIMFCRSRRSIKSTSLRFLLFFWEPISVKQFLLTMRTISMLWDCDVVCEQSLTGSSELPLFPCFLACCTISCGVSTRLFKLFDCRTFLCSLIFFCLSSLSKMIPLLDAILFSRFSKSSVFVADFFFETRLSSAVFASSSLLFSFALSWSYEKL